MEDDERMTALMTLRVTTIVMTMMMKMTTMMMMIDQYQSQYLFLTCQSQKTIAKHTLFRGINLLHSRLELQVH